MSVGGTSRTPAWGLDSVVLRLDAPPPTGLPSAEWAFGDSTGARVRVAVIDSGIEADHPALGACVDADGSVDVRETAGGTVEIVAGPHADVFGHGTACAGIIHALAPDARITSVRVLGPDLTGRAATFHAGLAWAVDQGFDVINLSLGTTKADWALAFHEVCDRAYFSGSFVVTAANNTRRASYPSLFASVASVACTTSRDPLRYHANPAPPTEFLARGIDVEVPWIGGTTNVSTGNSFAAPHIAGLAALVKGAHPELKPFQVKGLLWAGAANVREAAAAGRPVETAERAGRSPAEAARGTASALTQVIRVPVEPTVPASGPDRSPAQRDGTPAAHGPDSPPGGGAGPTGLRSDVAPVWRVGGYEAAGSARRSPWGVVIPARRGDQAVEIHDLRPLLSPSGDGGPAGEGGPADRPERLDRAERLVATVRASAAITHPHLQPVLDVVIDGGPLVVTPSLERVDESVRRPLVEVLAMALAVSSGLDALHRRGLAHGDLRLSGMGIDGRGGVRVGWCGIAAAVGLPSAPASRPSPESADDATWLSSVAHLAPERLDGAPPSPEADVYGIGLAVATLLLGRSPLPALTSFEAMQAQRRIPVDIDPEAIPMDLAAALAAAMSVDPSARPADASTLGRVIAWAAEETVGLAAVTASPLLRVPPPPV